MVGRKGRMFAFQRAYPVGPGNKGLGFYTVSGENKSWGGDFKIIEQPSFDGGWGKVLCSLELWLQMRSDEALRWAVKHFPCLRWGNLLHTVTLYHHS